MSQQVQQIGPYLIEVISLYWVLGLLLVFGVSLALGFAHRVNAATRFRIWWMTLTCTVVLPAMLFAPGWLDAKPLLSLFEPQTADVAGIESLEPVGSERQGRRGGFHASSHVAASGKRPTPWGLLLGGLGLGLAACWVFGAAWRLALLAISLRDLDRLRLSGTAAPPAVQEEVRLLAERSGLRAAPTVLLVRGLAGPAAAGVLQPWIALPADWPQGASALARRHALLHELAHVQRRDGLWGLLQRVIEGCLALHPAARLISRRLELERECACDDWAMLNAAAAPRGYGKSLLEFAELHCRAATRNRLIASYYDTPTQLRRRLANMLNYNRTHHSRVAGKPVFMVAAGLAVATLASASVWPALPSPSSGVSSGTAAQRTLDRSADEAPLFSAIRAGDLDRVRRLIDAGEDPNEVWHGDGSPMIVAASRGEFEIVRELLFRGAEVDLGVGGDGTPLIQAAANGDRDLVELLLDAGADIDHAGPGGDGNPLIQASLGGRLDLVIYLLDRGAEINIHVRDDDTPLINAAQQGHAAVVEHLLSAGADPDLTGDYDRRLEVVRTALNQAQSGGHEDIVRLLIQAGARQ